MRQFRDWFNLWRAFINWFPRICDMTPTDYFLWIYIDFLIYTNKPPISHDFEVNYLLPLEDYARSLVYTKKSTSLDELDFNIQDSISGIMTHISHMGHLSAFFHQLVDAIMRLSSPRQFVLDLERVLPYVNKSASLDELEVNIRDSIAHLWYGSSLFFHQLVADTTRLDSPRLYALDCNANKPTTLDELVFNISDSIARKTPHIFHLGYLTTSVHQLATAIVRLGTTPLFALDLH